MCLKTLLDVALVLIAFSAFLVSIWSLCASKRSNRISEQANTLSEEANAVAKDALTLSEQALAQGKEDQLERRHGEISALWTSQLVQLNDFRNRSNALLMNYGRLMSEFVEFLAGTPHEEQAIRMLSDLRIRIELLRPAFTALMKRMAAIDTVKKNNPSTLFNLQKGEAGGALILDSLVRIDGCVSKTLEELGSMTDCSADIVVHKLAEFVSATSRIVGSPGDPPSLV